MDFVNVIVDISHEKVDRIFQYRIPDHLKGRLKAGMQVNIPFGRGNRLVKGCVVGFSEKPDYPPEKIKELDSIAEGSVQAESQLIALAAWMRERYGSTMNQALKTVLPVKQKTRQKQSRRLIRKISVEEGVSLLEEYQRKKYRAKARLLEALLQNEVLDYQETVGNLKISSTVVRGFEEEGIIRMESRTLYRKRSSFKQ